MSFLLTFITLNLIGQNSNFNSELEKLTSQIAQKINNKGKKKVVVWDFTDGEGGVSKLGKYISEEVSISLTNAATTFQIMERQHLSSLLKEHKLKFEGVIDELTTKKLGQLQAIDAIVIGNLSILDGKLRLSMKVLDTETALIIAANKGDLPINSDISTLIDIPLRGGIVTTEPATRPINNPNQIIKPITVSKKCQENNTGDICFKNLYSESVKVGISLHSISPGVIYYENPSISQIIIPKGENRCLYDFKEGVYYYTVYKYHGISQIWRDIITSGQVRVNVCESESINISE